MRRVAADFVGQRFGRLVVTERAPNKGGSPAWACNCDCGRKVAVRAACLKRGNTKSCGCLTVDNAIAMGRRNRTHGHSKTRAYSIWCGMMARCGEPTHRNYPHYGGRGIAVCQRWRAFENFLADVGQPPWPGAELDRKDNGGNYAPDNWRWVSRQEQNNNKRDNRHLTLRGCTKTVSEWARDLGLNRNSLFGRLRLGWSDEDALTIPFRHMRNAGSVPSLR